MLRALPFLFYCFERLATQLRPDVRNHGAEIHPTRINNSFPLCDLKKKKKKVCNEAVSQHFSHLCYGNFFWPRWRARLSIMSEPSYLRGEHWGLSPHLPAPVTAKRSRNPASGIPVTGPFPSLLVLRLFPSLFFLSFVPRGSVEKWKQAYTQGFTYL